MKQNIEIIRGTSNTIQIRVTNADGDPLTLAGSEKIIFGVKKKPWNDECVLKKVMTEIENGICTVEIKPEDTEALEFGKYFYDVGMLSGDNYFNIIPSSVFHVMHNITDRGDGA